ALLSAGVAISGSGLVQPVALAVVVGLVVGKPVGVLGGTWLVTRFTRADLNDDVGWRDIVGLALVTGVGFTVSLLVSDLSFGGPLREEAKAGVLLGSVLAAVLAAVVLGRRNKVHRDA
ncbi:MAG: pH-dependent sodium/proton antiporter, partial [Nocardioidaceae bacterium]|nr:pH-dependent sodium/proton antiporter [Nocardioidaceae bacterium]